MNHCVYYKVLNRAGTSVSVTKKHIYNLKIFHMTFEMSPCALTYIYIFLLKPFRNNMTKVYAMFFLTLLFADNNCAGI